MNESAQVCPWSQYPTGNFPVCEEKLCEWIRQPANSYSNIGFILLGVFLIYLYLNRKSQHGLSFGLASIFVGLCSFLAHSAGISLFTFLDFSAVFLIFAVFAAHNTVFDKKNKTYSLLILTSFYLIPAIIIMYFITATREIIFAISVIGLMSWEFFILKKQGKPFLTTSMKKVLVCFTIAVICLALDTSKIICDPQNHFFQLHALWHIFNATSIYFLARHLDEHHV